MEWIEEMFFGMHMMKTVRGEKRFLLSVTPLKHCGFFLLGTERGDPDLFPDVRTPLGPRTPFGAHVIHFSTHDTMDEAMSEARNEIRPKIEQLMLSMEN